MTEDGLMLALSDGKRYVYRIRDSDRWAITCGGQVDPALVDALKRQGRLRPVFDGSEDALWPGRTIDVQASMAERRKERLASKRTAVVYVDASALRMEGK